MTVSWLDLAGSWARARRVAAATVCLAEGLRGIRRVAIREWRSSQDAGPLRTHAQTIEQLASHLSRHVDAR